MAKQTINQGTAPTGAGGDTFRTGSAKLQENDDELYAQLGANTQGVLPAALPVNKGGTGATTANGAITALGLENVFHTKVDALHESKRSFNLAINFAQNVNVIRIDLDITNLTSFTLSWKFNSRSHVAGFGGMHIEQFVFRNASNLAEPTYLKTVFNRCEATTRGYIYFDPTLKYDSIKNTYYILIHRLTVPNNAVIVVDLEINRMLGAFNATNLAVVSDATASQTHITNLRNEPTLPDISSGGTGATTAAQARTNLGLGTAATANIGTSNSGEVVPTAAETISDFLTLGSRRSGFFMGSGAGALNFPVSELNLSYGGVIQVYRSPYSFGLCLFANNNYSPRLAIYSLSNGVIKEAKVYTTINTTVDANGFIKAASPIVELYADRIELNAEAQQQDITFEKLGVGDYLIKGSSGFAQEGWYVEQPKDANGNIFHAVVYEQLDNGDISVKTYEKRINETGLIAADPNKPIDIKENRFISIRLQELPTEEIEPEVDQTILDDEGQPAPSQYHTLENGVWVISGEDAERLEQEQLAKMQPLTRRQFRLALAMNGYDLSQVEALIDQIPDPMQRQIALIEWQDATTFERLNPSLLAMADLMGLSAEQVNMLWNQALTL